MPYILHNSDHRDVPFCTTPMDFLHQQHPSPEELRTTLFLLPTARLQRSTERAMISWFQQNNHVIPMRPALATLSSFTRTCARKLLQGDVYLVGEGYRLSLMEECIHQTPLPFFRPDQRTVSLSVVEKLYSIINGLRKKGITPNTMASNIAVAEQDEQIIHRAKVDDIHRLYEVYTERINGTCTDETGLLHRITAVLRDHPEALHDVFPDVSHIHCMGFTEFHLPEIHLLQALAGTTSILPTRLMIHLDYSPDNGPLFGGLAETIAQLHTAGFQSHRTDTNTYTDTASLAVAHVPSSPVQAIPDYIRRWLFNTEKHIHHDRLPHQAHIYSFCDRISEVRGIVKYVKHCLLHDGIAPHEICILSQQPGIYTPIFREMCSLYQIPANITDRFTLDTSPVVTAIFSVLDMLIGGYHRDDVRRVMTTPYLSMPCHPDGTALDVENLFAVADQLRIIGGNRNTGKGSDVWIEKMNQRLLSLTAYKETLLKGSLPDEDALAECNRTLHAIEQARADFLVFIAEIDQLQPATLLTSEEFEAFLMQNVIRHFRIKQNIMAFHATIQAHSQHEHTDKETRHSWQNTNTSAHILLHDEIEKDTRALVMFIGAVHELRFVQDTLSHPTSTKKLDVFIDKLRTMCIRTPYQVLEKPLSTVTITSPEQIRHIPFRVTIICGMIHGEFPARYVPESFLGMELLDSEDRFLKQERMTFYQAITNHAGAWDDGSKRLILTYPRMIGESAVTRSSFIDALLKISTPRLADTTHPMVTDLPEETLYLHTVETSKQLPKWHNVPANKEEYIRAGVHNMLRYASYADQHSLLKTLDIQQEFVDTITHRLDIIAQRKQTDLSRVEFQRDMSGIPEHAPYTYSISKLEKYQQCPYQFYLTHTLLLRQREEMDTALSPTESGSLLHAIAYRFYTDLQAESQRETIMGIGSAPLLRQVVLDEKQYEKYARHLLKIAHEELERIRYDHPFFQLDEEELIGRSHHDSNSAEERLLGGKLSAWLYGEIQRSRNTTYYPSGFELNFTGTSADHVSLRPVRLSALLELRGKIDRVDIEIQHDVIRFIIVDYKKGKAQAQPRDSAIREGYSLQMPLYARAMEIILREQYGKSAYFERAEYISFDKRENLQDNGTKARRSLLADDEIKVKGSKKANTLVTISRAELIDHAIHRADTIITDILSGVFHIEPHKKKKPCEYCSFSSVCRIKEIQYNT